MKSMNYETFYRTAPSRPETSKTLVAWGASKLLKMYLKQAPVNPFSYCVDNFSVATEVDGLPIRKIDTLLREERGAFRLVVFAVSNRSLQAILSNLFSLGLHYGEDFILYSDFFLEDFIPLAERALESKLDPAIYRYSLSYSLNSLTPIHTTILGTWMLLEILKKTSTITGEIAELGIFHGGNALCCLNFMHGLMKKFYLFDSFEGFPEISLHDPAAFSRGDYKIETSYNEILAKFAPYPEAKLVRGFIPGTLAAIPEGEKFSLVFYDCDLYQPALDTFAFFWEKLTPGGYMVVHDYAAEEGGFTGVKMATHEFFDPLGKPVHSFFHNTMALIKK